MKKSKTLLTALLSVALMFSIVGCTKTTQVSNNTTESTTQSSTKQSSTSSSSGSTVAISASASDYFTERDMTQEADLSEATYITVTSNATVEITEAGVYVLTGTATEAQIIVETDEEDKVQLVLDSLSITNSNVPAIYVKSADKVFVTTTDSKNYLSVTGTFSQDGTTNTDAVIYSKEDLVLNGKGTLTVKSTGNGITSKDDLKVTGGTYVITASNHGLEGKDSVVILDGTFTINAGKDGIHSENSDDNTLGYVYIFGGTFSITAKSDGIQAITVLMVEDGTLNISASEGLEATQVVIDGGSINISASDDGVNAAKKTTALNAKIEINGGNLTIKMSSGDTDAVDSNGSLIITGGYIDITAQFAFDYDGTVTFTGGTVIVNGTQVTSISNSMMGGPNNNQNMSGEQNGFRRGR